MVLPHTAGTARCNLSVQGQNSSFGTYLLRDILEGSRGEVGHWWGWRSLSCSTAAEPSGGFGLGRSWRKQVELTQEPRLQNRGHSQVQVQEAHALPTHPPFALWGYAVRTSDQP